MYNRRDFVRNSLKDVIDEGLNQMKDQNLSESGYNIWLSYSQRVLEISTKDYNPEILLNYLRVIMSIDKQLKPYEKIAVCLNYLIGLLGII